VLSGTETSNAVRLTATEWAGRAWLLGVPGLAMAIRFLPGHQHHAVALPVSTNIWRMWQRRNLVALSALAAGVTFAGIGLFAGLVGLVVLGAIVLIGAAAYRTRAQHDYWVTCRFRPADGTIVVEPTHRAFDEAARDLFVRSLR
jgi:hypothetical protein